MKGGGGRKSSARSYHRFNQLFRRNRRKNVGATEIARVSEDREREIGEDERN